MAQRLDKAERKKRILHTAMKVFAQQGFRGTTSKAIAKAAEISEAMVFKLFPSKKSLYTAILEAKMAELATNSLPHEAVKASNDRAVLCSTALTFIKRVESDPTFMRLLLFSALEGQPLAPMFFKARGQTISHFLEEYFRRRIQQKDFRKLHPMLLARTFTGTIAQYLIQTHIFHLPRPVAMSHKEYVEMVVELFLNGVLNRKRRRNEP